MKKVLMPTEGGKIEIWAVVHDLTLAEGRLRKLRPIHVLTHLAQHREAKPSLDTFAYALALENKLTAVRFMHRELYRAMASFDPDVYSKHRVRDYEPEQFVIAALEAYLNALYSCLEIISVLNRRFYFKKNLPEGFRKQSKRVDLFDFKNWQWLQVFYDLRSEMTHYNSPLPTISEQSIIIEFKTGRDLQFFEKK